MSSGPSRVFDEFAKVLTDAAGAAQGLKQEAETAIKSQAERFLSDMDLVQREEFDAVKAMAAKARDENEALKAQMESLEKRLSDLENSAK